MLEDNKVQNHHISSDLEVNSKAMVTSLTYLNVIVTDGNLHHKITHDLDIL